MNKHVSTVLANAVIFRSLPFLLPENPRMYRFSPFVVVEVYVPPVKLFVGILLVVVAVYALSSNKYWFRFCHYKIWYFSQSSECDKLESDQQ